MTSDIRIYKHVRKSLRKISDELIVVRARFSESSVKQINLAMRVIENEVAKALELVQHDKQQRELNKK